MEVKAMDIVPSELSRDPFRSLFLEFLESFNVADISSKTQCLQEFIRSLEELESHTENESTFLYWAGFGCGFCTLLTLAGAATLNPLLGGLVYAISGSSAIGVFGMTFKQNQDRRPVVEKLRRYRIALKSDNALNWACLWEYAGTDIFLGSLYQASGGYLRDNRTLIRNDGKNPMAAALDSCCQYYGISREELIGNLKQLKAGVAVKIPTVPKALEPVAHSEKRAMLPEVATTPKDWLKGFLSSTCLVWGNQGSGKSWFVRHLVKEKIAAGYRVVVFDPNSNKHEWRGVELFNRYEDIEEQMRLYVAEVQGRYSQFGDSDISEEEWRSQLWREGKAITFVCEEATTYTDFIQDKELLATFVKVATTLSRKQEMPVIFVAHNNTQTCLGDIKGLANLIGRMQQIQLLATTDPATAQPVASGKALIKLDGSDKWIEVLTPKIESKIRDFGEEREPVTNSYQTTRSQLEKLFKVETKGENIQDTPKVFPSLSPDAQLVLSYFDNAKAKTPKSVKDLKDANKLRTLTQSQLMKALSQLIAAEILDIDEEGNYLKVDW